MIGLPDFKAQFSDELDYAALFMMLVQGCGHAATS